MRVRIFYTSWKSLDRLRALDFFDKEGIEYKEYDINTDKRALMYLVGKIGVPKPIDSSVIIEMGGEFIKGFDAPRIRNILENNGMGQ